MTVVSQVKQTLASLKGVKGTLRVYLTQTQSAEAQSVYEEALETADEVISDLEERVRTLEFEEPQYKGK